MTGVIIFVSLVIVGAFGVGLVAYNIGKVIGAAKQSDADRRFYAGEGELV